MEAIRETTPRPRTAGRREVHRTPRARPGKKKRYYQYTAIDDCTRLRVLRAYPTHDQKTAIRFIDHVLSKLPFKVEKVQTDNGSTSSGRSSTGTCSTKASATSTSSPPHPGSTGRSRDPTGSTQKSSTASSKARSSTTSTSSTTNSKNGRTTTTTIDPTAPSQAAHPTRD